MGSRAVSLDLYVDPDELQRIVRQWLSGPERFSRLVVGLPLRSYQLEPARAILDSIVHGRGRSFVVMMSRQAGKNELSGQLEAYLLNLFRRRGGQIVKASPTFKPQTLNSILRLCDRLDNPWNRGQWRKREGYIVQLGKARAFFFSADPSANVVGATADILLECDEAQDVEPAKWDKDFVPMGASTNVTTVYWGTAWTSDTMLARTAQHLRRLEARDGVRRVFRYDAEQVGAEVPAYAEHVRRQVARLGRQHPLIKTQYYLEEIDGQGGLFHAARRALMRGDHPRQREPGRAPPFAGRGVTPGRRYAMLIDVGGEDELGGDPVTRSMLANPRRDATALTLVEVSVRHGELPRYRAVERRLWIGTPHTRLYHELLAWADAWRPVWIVVDATGVGAGLASALSTRLGERVIPVTFSPRVKSDLGWDFLAIVETGRYRDYAEDGEADTRQFWYEVEACQYEVSQGPGHQMRWGVWEAPAYDGAIARGHDDLLISAAMCAVLDRQPWPGTGESVAVEMPDPLDDIDRGRW